MRNFRQLVVQVGLLIGCLFYSPDANAATVSAASCSYPDVSSAVIASVAGDTVTVPSGSCTWTSVLSITKGITLQGAGIGNTVISGSNGLISYAPSNPATNALFRLTGFTFDFSNANGMTISSSATVILQTKVRIDHNRFRNSNAQYIHYRGVRGVIDNNQFAPTAYPLRTEFEIMGNGGKAEWENWEGVKFGQVDNSVYFEDNTFEGVSSIVTDCQVGERYSFRYNTINLTAALFPMFDMHGNQSSSFYSCFGGELYGNTITGGQGGTFLDQRGGRVFVFNNNVTASMNLQIREEYDDAISPVAYVGPNPPQMSQHVSGSYYWGNRVNLTGSPIQPFINTTCSQCVQNGLVAGVNFFAETTSPAMTAGTLASRPATCSIGQGYWGTSQSTTNLTGMVGANPTTPISGTLYQCTAPNTWDSGRSPLAYPHPLRSGADTTSPAAPQNILVF